MPPGAQTINEDPRRETRATDFPLAGARNWLRPGDFLRVREGEGASALSPLPQFSFPVCVRLGGGGAFGGGV
jgi:hypothetical protein